MIHKTIVLDDEVALGALQELLLWVAIDVLDTAVPTLKGETRESRRRAEASNE
jgi:hypothetical protein